MWQPIETAKKSQQIILLCEEEKNVHAGYWDDVFERWITLWATTNPFCKPTHWMPLPDPPPIQQTFGQKAVGISFNPSGNDAVNVCKETFAKAIDQMNDLRLSTGSGEVKRMCALAITDAQTGPNVGREGHHLVGLVARPAFRM